MRNIKIILNPNAGKAKGILPEITNILKEKNITFEVLPTNFPGEAKALAKKASEDKTAELLLVIGGDGTINEAVNGLVNSTLPLGIIPAGSLNCAAREIGLSPDPKKAACQLLEGSVKTIHIGKISFLDKNTDFVFKNEKERYFLLMAGIGFDAKAVADFNPKLKKIIGPLAYVWSGLKQIFFVKHPAIKIETNQKVVTGYSCIINKFKTYAWFDFAPEAGIEKDFFQMFVYTKNDILSLIRYSIGGMFGWHRKFSDVESGLIRNAKITSGSIAYIQADGESVGKLPVEIAVMPNALKIMLPKK
ncbi:MAG: diacylglycerol kinase family lipid kinase [bacterium]|nr:diacylglycerol kinase family lipid kinase [bacterium]